MTFISGMWFYVFSITVFKTVVKMHWIAKPFILPLQMFLPIKNNTRFQTTRTKLAASGS